MANPSQRYVSTELAHFVGRDLGSDEGRYELLKKILSGGELRSKEPGSFDVASLLIDSNEKFSSNKMYLPYVVCFCDIPAADLEVHVKKYSRFGLSFNKDFVVEKGGTPIQYIPIKSKVDYLVTKMDNPLGGEKVTSVSVNTIGEYFDEMITAYHKNIKLMGKKVSDNGKWIPRDDIASMGIQDFDTFFSFHLLSLIKFYDHTKNDGDAENFYLEREWRVWEKMTFGLEDIETIFIPKEFKQRFRDDFSEYTSQLIFLK